MAEALVAASLVSAIVQFIDFGSKIIERLDEFKSNVDNVPKSFQDIKAEIPLLLNTLKQTKEEAEAQCYGEDTLQALLPVVECCRSQVELLNDTLLKMLPNPGDRTWRRTIKAFQCVDQEKKVQQITNDYSTSCSDINTSSSGRRLKAGLKAQTDGFLVSTVRPKCSLRGTRENL